MKLSRSLRFLPLVLPLFAMAAAACATETNEDELVESSESGLTNPLASLRTDWKVRASAYLDVRANLWLTSPPQIGNVRCAMSCHTTFPHLMTRAMLLPKTANDAGADGATALATPTTADGGGTSPSVGDVARGRFETRVAEAAAETSIPFYGSGTSAKVKESHATEAILNAAALSFDDLGSGRPLTAAAKTALDVMWSEQRADGTWDWLEFGLEPWERGDDWGAALAALVAGTVPANTSPGQAAGTAKVKTYLRGHVATMALHDRAMTLWASSKLTGLLTPAEVASIVSALAPTQLVDGGFSLGSWGRGHQAATVADKSDGYATALAALALCTGTPNGKDRPDVHRALKWLATHQAIDGSWPGQSVNSTSDRARGFMTDASTAYATIAITTCVD